MWQSKLPNLQNCTFAKRFIARSRKTRTLSGILQLLAGLVDVCRLLVKLTRKLFFLAFCYFICPFYLKTFSVNFYRIKTNLWLKHLLWISPGTNLHAVSIWRGVGGEFNLVIWNILMHYHYHHQHHFLGNLYLTNAPTPTKSQNRIMLKKSFFCDMM